MQVYLLFKIGNGLCGKWSPSGNWGTDGFTSGGICTSVSWECENLLRTLMIPSVCGHNSQGDLRLENGHSLWRMGCQRFRDWKSIYFGGQTLWRRWTLLPLP